MPEELSEKLPEKAVTPPAKPDPMPRRQVARWTQEFVRWMPLGGSGWAFFGFGLQQQWMQAVMMLPVTAATGVWAAYSKNFVEQLQEIYSDRARADAQSLVTGMDSLNEALKWQFSGFDANYLKAQSGACMDYYGDDFKQQRGFLSPMLSQVFVPLMLDPATLAPNGRSPHPVEELETNGVQIWDLLAQVRQVPAYQFMAIVADGGFGKTTLLRHITYTYGQGRYRRYRAPKLTPVLIYLRKWHDRIVKDQLSLPQLMQQHVQDLCKAKPLTMPPLWAESRLQNGHALVMIDGFDEVSEANRPAIAQWITTQVQTYGRSVFILSSRRGGFEVYQKLTDQMPTTLTVREFNQEQRAAFLQPWYLCQQQHQSQRKTPDVAQIAAQRAADLIEQIEQQPDLCRLAENPLLLNLIAWVHWYAPGDQLPRERVRLYQSICDLQLGDRPLAKRVVMLLDSPQERQQVLQGLALEMVRQETAQLERQAVLEALRPPLHTVDEIAVPEQFLKDVTDIGELLYEPDPGEYAFSHLSFRNYFAALEIQRTGQEATLLNQWHNDKWAETILLYSALLKPQPLMDFVRQSCQLGQDAVSLAYRCFQKYPNPDRLAVAFAAELQPLRYQQLETCLRHQQWKKADYETYRLMIQTVGKHEGDYFTSRELLNFPGSDLRIVDDLWTRYSNGHFGFSVQKAIYVRCGGKLDGKYPGKEVWELFGDTVGWRLDQEWQDYYDLTLSLSSPQGVFPGGGRGGWLFGVGWVLMSSSLSSRLVRLSTRQF